MSNNQSTVIYDHKPNTEADTISSKSTSENDNVTKNEVILLNSAPHTMSSENNSTTNQNKNITEEFNKEIKNYEKQIEKKKTSISEEQPVDLHTSLPNIDNDKNGILSPLPDHKTASPSSDEHDQRTPPSHDVILNENLIKDGNLKRILKQYTIKKDPTYIGFGIILQTEKDDDYDSTEYEPFFPSIEIEEFSPAFAAGLENDQRLIAINNQYINTNLKTIEELASLIDACFYTNRNIEIVVIDPEDWDKIKDDNNILISLNILENKEIVTELNEDTSKNTVEPILKIPEPPKEPNLGFF